MIVWRRASVYVVCRDDAGRLLLTRFVSPDSPDTGRWTMPGGGMKWGESPEATAHRELEEETGLTATLGPIAGVFSRWFTESESARGEAGHVVGIVYEVTAVSGQLRKEFEPGTTDAAQWFTIDEARAVPHVELVDFVFGLIA